MDASECLFMDEVFTHIAEDGTVRHFNASAMLRAVPSLLASGKITHIQVAMDKEFVEFIIQRRGVKRAKLEKLCEPHLSKPVIGVEGKDGTVLTVDGHHRIVVLDSLGAEDYGMYLFPLGTWDAFLVDIPEDFSQYLAECTMIEQGDAAR